VAAAVVPYSASCILVAPGVPLGLLPFTDYQDDPSFISSDRPSCH